MKGNATALACLAGLLPLACEAATSATWSDAATIASTITPGVRSSDPLDMALPAGGQNFIVMGFRETSDLRRHLIRQWSGDTDTQTIFVARDHVFLPKVAKCPPFCAEYELTNMFANPYALGFQKVDISRMNPNQLATTGLLDGARYLTTNLGDPIGLGAGLRAVASSPEPQMLALLGLGALSLLIALRSRRPS